MIEVFYHHSPVVSRRPARDAASHPDLRIRAAPSARAIRSLRTPVTRESRTKCKGLEALACLWPDLAFWPGAPPDVAVSLIFAAAMSTASLPLGPSIDDHPTWNDQGDPAGCRVSLTRPEGGDLQAPAHGSRERRRALRAVTVLIQVAGLMAGVIVVRARLLLRYPCSPA
jgi:hypothetical protein